MKVPRLLGELVVLRLQLLREEAIGVLLRWYVRRLEKQRASLRHPAPSSLICVRQADTWTWPAHLGAKTAGICADCGAPIYYELQNMRVHPKVCSVCAWGFGEKPKL